MASVLTDHDVTVRITCDVTPGDLTMVTLPPATFHYLIQFVGGAGQIAISGVDGAAIGAAYATVTTNTTVQWPAPGSLNGTSKSERFRATSPVIYVAHAGISGVVEITPLGG